MDEQTTALIQAIGPRLFDLRVAAGLTVREAARLVGVDHSMIVRYENGRALPPLDRLITLALCYGTTPAALLAGTSERMPLIARIDQADAATLARLAAALSG
jgi:transcriptional regulator with XRE-family HTH domain